MNYYSREDKTRDDLLREEGISSESVFDGVLLHVKKDTVRLPDGNTATRELIRHNGAACVIPIDGEGNVVMVRQCRYAIGEITTEIPAGKLDGRGEDPLLCAKRELKEETGATAGQWLDLGLYYGTPAYADEKVYMYAAKELSFGERHLDDDEFLFSCRVPLAKLVDAVLRGKISDGKTQVAVLKLWELRRRGEF